jgi:hypothetical protein
MHVTMMRYIWQNHEGGAWGVGDQGVGGLRGWEPAWRKEAGDLVGERTTNPMPA